MSCGNDPWATKEAAAHGRDVPQGNEWLSDWVMVLASVMPIRWNTWICYCHLHNTLVQLSTRSI